MDYGSIVDVESVNPQIPSFITDYYLIPNMTPLDRRVELLVDVTIETEGRSSDLPSKSKVSEAFFEGLEPLEFGI